MKNKLPFVLSLGALSLAACKREQPSAADKTPAAAEAQATSDKAPAATLAPPTGSGPIHSTDVPTVGELAAADPRTAKIMAKVSTIVVDQLGVAADKVMPAADLRKDLGADSLDTVELIMALEEEFNISIKDEDAEKIRTVGDAVKTVISLGAR